MFFGRSSRNFDQPGAGCLLAWETPDGLSTFALEEGLNDLHTMLTGDSVGATVVAAKNYQPQRMLQPCGAQIRLIFKQLDVAWRGYTNCEMKSGGADHELQAITPSVVVWHPPGEYATTHPESLGSCAHRN